MRVDDDPLPVAATEGLSARAMLWRRAGREMLTVVGKMRFVAAHAAVVTPVDPLVPATLVSAKPDDLVPFRPRADVVVGGRDLGPASSLRYRRRGTFLIQKRCRVGAELVVAARPRLAPGRAARLGNVDPRRLEGLEVDVPADLDPLYFQCAPEDQQIDAIVEGDVVGVDLGVGGAAAIEWTVPNVRVEAHLQVDGRPVAPVLLRPDGLYFDADRGLVSLTVRAQMPAPSASSVASLVVAASVAGAPIAWVPFPAARGRRPSPSRAPTVDPSPPPPRSVQPFTPSSGVEGTMAFTPEDIAAAKHAIASAGVDGVHAPPQVARAVPPAPPPPSFTPRPSAVPAPPPPSFAPRPSAVPAAPSFSAAPSFGAPPVAAPPSPDPKGEAKSIDGTLLQSDLDIARLRAMFATPFEAAKKGGAPISVGPLPSPEAPPVPKDAPFNVTAQATDAPPPASTPFVKGAFVPMSSEPEPHLPTGTMLLGGSSPAVLPTPFVAGASTAVTPSRDASPGWPSDALHPPLGGPEPRALATPFATEAADASPPDDISATRGISPADILAARLPFRAATEDDVPVALPEIPWTSRAEERAPDLSGTMVASQLAAPRKTAARVVPFGPARVHAGLVATEERGKLGKAFLSALKRMQVADGRR